MERFVPGEDFEDYVDIFDQYCVAKGVAEDKKVAELLSAIGVDTFRILKLLTFSTKPKDKPLEDIVTVLTDHFRPTANPVAERYKLNKRIQQPGESASSYVALRDRYISGPRDDKLQKQLINTEGLTFEQAVKTATSWELADEQVKTMEWPSIDCGEKPTQHVNESGGHRYTESTSIQQIGFPLTERSNSEKVCPLRYQ
jgi:hypothetical protein